MLVTDAHARSAALYGARRTRMTIPPILPFTGAEPSPEMAECRRNMLVSISPMGLHHRLSTGPDIR